MRIGLIIVLGVFLISGCLNRQAQTGVPTENIVETSTVTPLINSPMRTIESSFGRTLISCTNEIDAREKNLNHNCRIEIKSGRARNFGLLLYIPKTISSTAQGLSSIYAFKILEDDPIIIVYHNVDVTENIRVTIPVTSDSISEVPVSILIDLKEAPALDSEQESWLVDRMKSLKDVIFSPEKAKEIETTLNAEFSKGVNLVIQKSVDKKLIELGAYSDILIVATPKYRGSGYELYGQASLNGSPVCDLIHSDPKYLIKFEGKESGYFNFNP